MHLAKFNEPRQSSRLFGKGIFVKSVVFGQCFLEMFSNDVPVSAGLHFLSRARSRCANYAAVHSILKNRIQVLASLKAPFYRNGYSLLSGNLGNSVLSQPIYKLAVHEMFSSDILVSAKVSRTQELYKGIFGKVLCILKR